MICVCGHWDVVHDMNYGCVAWNCQCKQTPRMTPMDDVRPELVLQEAVHHLAGLGRGKWHRLDIEAVPNAKATIIKLDHVPLRGVVSYEVSSEVGGITRLRLELIVSVGKENDP